MISWEQRRAEHSAMVALNEAVDLAGLAIESVRSNPDSDALQYAEATSVILGDVQKRLLLVDARLIPDQMLTDMERPSSRVRDILSDFKRGGELSDDNMMGLVRSAHSEAEQLLENASGIPVSPWSDNADSIVGDAAPTLTR